MILLDTNVVSEAMKENPDPAVIRWMDSQSVETLYLSCVTVGELRAGVEVAPEGKKKKMLSDRLEGRVLPLFAGRILAFDVACSRAYAEIFAINRRKGSRVSLPDAFVAAIAATHVMSVATRDTRPFESSGVAVINPWGFAGT